MHSNTTFQPEDEFIRRPALLELVGMSKSHQIRLEKSGKFPKRFKIGKRCVGWSLSEIRQWMDAKKNARSASNDKPV
jgi:prophage regulatory protein